MLNIQFAELNVDGSTGVYLANISHTVHCRLWNLRRSPWLFGTAKTSEYAAATHKFLVVIIVCEITKLWHDTQEVSDRAVAGLILGLYLDRKTFILCAARRVLALMPNLTESIGCFLQRQSHQFYFVFEVLHRSSAYYEAADAMLRLRESDNRRGKIHWW